MSKDRDDAIQNILEKVNPSRRGFLKQVLLGGGVVAALAVPASFVEAQEKKDEGKGDEGKAKGKGKGKGKDAKGKGKGEDEKEKTEKK
jgi:hypothetical protein